MTEKEYKRQKAREYYLKNREKIKEHNRLRYWKDRRDELEKKLMEENRPELEFLTEWNKSLQERLTDPHLKKWLRTAISLILEENKGKIQAINEQISRQVNQDTGKTGF